MASKDEKNIFSTMIENRCRSHGTSVMETILEYCEETCLEPEVAGTLLTVSLKSRLEEEARKLRFIKRPPARKPKYPV